MGNVRLLKPEEVGLTEKIQIFEDGIRTEAKRGSYEWWYFDSKYADGSSLVIIFYTKHVTSFAKNFKPFVSLNYTSATGKEIKTELWSDDYSFSKDRCDVRIGDCYIKGNLSHYDIYFKNDEVECKLSLDASVPSWRPDSGKIMFGKKDYFAWLPSVPEGKVVGTLKTKDESIELDGTGYHDHNWGNKLMLLLMNDWYWGRAKIGDYVVVSSYIYATKKDGYKATPIFMLAKDGEIFVLDMGKPVRIDDLARNMITLSGFRPDVDIAITYTGLRPGEKLYEELLLSEEGLERTPNNLIFIGHLEPIDSVDFEEKLNALRIAAEANSPDIRSYVKALVRTYCERKES